MPYITTSGSGAKAARPRAIKHRPTRVKAGLVGRYGADCSTPAGGLSTRLGRRRRVGRERPSPVSRFRSACVQRAACGSATAVRTMQNQTVRPLTDASPTNGAKCARWPVCGGPCQSAPPCCAKSRRRQGVTASQVPRRPDTTNGKSALPEDTTQAQGHFDQARDALRLNRYSHRAEDAYVDWMSTTRSASSTANATPTRRGAPKLRRRGA